MQDKSVKKMEAPIFPVYISTLCLFIIGISQAILLQFQATVKVRCKYYFIFSEDSHLVNTDKIFDDDGKLRTPGHEKITRSLLVSGASVRHI